MTAFNEFPPPHAVPPPEPAPRPEPGPVAPAPLPVTATKAWITGMGGLVSTIVSYVVAASIGWPEPWPAVVALVGWAVTTFFAHQIPNKPLAVQPTAVPPKK